MMKKTAKKNGPIMTLYEEVDFSLLARIISSKNLSPDIKKQLRTYYSKREHEGDRVPVQYFYSANLNDQGRLFAENSLSLQSFKKEIRHALAKDSYYDIDMVNSHPVLLSQYCEKNNIMCPELDAYVENREEYLKKIQKFHKIDRDEAKKLILALSYGGGYKINDEVPEKKIEMIVNLHKELKSISKDVCRREIEIYNIVKTDDTKLNKNGATLSIVSQKIESECLMAMYKFFTEEKKLKVGTLCFDGLLLNKYDDEDDHIPEETINKYLKECQKYVKKTTGYEITLLIKPMDLELTFKIPEFSLYVSSDADCQKQLFLIEGREKFQYCQGQLYIYDEITGIYSQDEVVLFFYLERNSRYLTRIMGETKQGLKTANYGTDTSLQRAVIQQVKRAARNDKWLLDSQNSSKGYLLFNNGIYNFKTKEFSEGFDPKIVFHGRIPFDFQERNKKEVKYAMDLSFNQLFDDPSLMIGALARAFAGDTEIKKFYFGPGKGNAGKSIFIKMLEICFGDYVGNMNCESLAQTADHDTKDEAAKNRWSYLVQNTRVLIASEMNMKKKLDGNAIKKHSSGGDKVTGRTHGGEEQSFRPQYTIFCLLNDIPEIEPFEDPVKERVEIIKFPHVFVDPKKVSEKPFYREKDMDIGNKIKELPFINGFIHIILDGYQDYQENGMPEYDNEAKEEWFEGGQQDTQIKDLLEKSYDVTLDESDRITVKELNEWKKKNKIFNTISAKRFNEILRDDLGLKEKKSTDRFWLGIRKSNNNNNVDFLDD